MRKLIISTRPAIISTRKAGEKVARPALRTHRSAIFLVVLLASACSNDGNASTTTTTTTPATPTSAAPATATTTTATVTTTTVTTTLADSPPGQVTGVAARSGGGSGEVVIAWTQNPEPDVVSYTISWATIPGGASAPIGTMTRAQVNGFPTTAFVDVPPVRVAYYRIRAVDAAGNQGPLSIEVCGASPATFR